MEDFLHFLEECPTPYHYVAYARRLLSEHGFVELCEKEHFPDPMPEKAFLVRDERAIIAYVAGGKESVVGVCAHSDSPCFRLKPNYETKTIGDQQILNFSMYGTALWSTFLDRDLKVAGSVLVSDSKNSGKLSHKLVDSKRPIAIIPNHAIHHGGNLALSPQYNAEKSFNAIIGSIKLRPYIASLLEIPEDDIVDWDLRFVDSNPPSALDNLVFSGRLDDLSCCYAGLMALLDDDNENNCRSTRILAVFDFEQAGSSNRYGAKSDFLNTVIEAIFSPDKNKMKYISIKNNSLLLSCDNCHGTHPIGGSASDPLNTCELGKGPAIKSTTKSDLASEMIGAAIVKVAAENCKQKVQVLIPPNNQSARQTIGPNVQFKTGIRTVDIGCPMLSMGSCRETIHWTDVDSLSKILKDIYKNYNDYRLHE